MSDSPTRRGPPPLKPFGLLLHHDGRWTHEGQPIRNAKLRSKFDTSVRYLPEEAKYVVQLAHFRAEIELQEAGFFVRNFDLGSGQISLSDGSEEVLDVASLHLSGHDGALLCRVKRDLAPVGLLARFHHAAHAEFLHHVEEAPSGPVIPIAGRPIPLPEL